MKPLHLIALIAAVCSIFLYLFKLGRPADRVAARTPITLPDVMTADDLVGRWRRVGMRVGEPLTRVPEVTALSTTLQIHPNGTLQGAIWVTTDTNAIATVDVGRWTLEGNVYTVTTGTNSLRSIVSVTNNLFQCHTQDGQDMYVYYEKLR